MASAWIRLLGTMGVFLFRQTCQTCQTRQTPQKLVDLLTC